MLYSLYTIKDEAIGYGAPMMQNNDAAATRAFAHECMNKDSYWNSHPADFSLWCIGSFDTHSGMIVEDEMKLIARASDFVIKEK